MNKFIKIFIIFFFVCCNLNSYSQTINGKLIDSSKKAVAGATIILQKKDSTCVDAVISDDNGNFVFNDIDSIDGFHLFIQHLSYEPLYIKYNHHNIGIIELSQKVLNMDEIVVEGKQPVITIENGKLKYNMNNILDKYITSNAYEAICKLPMVQERNGKLALVGTSEVSIIINGKPSTLSQEQITEFLKTLSATQIKSVEIMYNTSPEYHVHGASINIATEQAENNSFKTEVSTTYKNQYFNSYNGNINILASKGKSSLNFSYAPKHSHTMTLLDLQSMHNFQGKYYDISHSQSLTNEGLKHNIYGEYNYNSKNNTISAGYNGSYSAHGEESIKVTGNYQNCTNYIKKDNKLHNLFISYSSSFGLDLGIDYTFYNLEALNTLEGKINTNNLYLLDYTTKQQIRKVSFYIDQIHELNNNWIFKYGGNYQYTENYNSQIFTNIEGNSDAKSAHSRLCEQTTNLYVGVDKEFDSGLSLSLSAIAEYYSIGDYNQWSIYPQANITYNPTENHTIMLGLSTKKDYPAYWDMMNSTTYMNAYEELQTTIGLQPATIYSVNANYLFKQKYMLSLFYENTSDYFSMDMYQSKDRLALIYKTQNWNYYKTWGMSFSIPFDIGNHITSEINASLLNDRIRNDNYWDIPFNRKKWAYMITCQNNIKLNSKLKFNFDVMYRSSMISGANDTKPIFVMNTSMQWKILKNKANISLFCSDIFDSARMKVHNHYSGQNIKLDMGKYNRSIGVKFLYSFGGKINKGKKEFDTERLKQ
ncbi:MAG: outer membrane beta-barrel protein [Bacilli bacterium]|nr:outer membrane beta-barrel protein [Bacilli bacterium]